jgi:hypothetical protein
VPVRDAGLVGPLPGGARRDVLKEASTMSDVEVPYENADALEVDESVPDEDEALEPDEQDEVDLEAPEADVVEQRREVDLREDDYA